MSSSEHTRKFLNPPPNGSSLLTGSEFNTGSNCSDWSGCVDQHTATIAFNEIAVQLNLDLLPPNENLEPSSLGEPPHSTRLDAVNGPGPVGVVKLTKRRSRIFGRLRSIGSSFQLKRSGSQERTVRRMKTFAHLPSRSYEMNSLRGKSLETLARLGGHSFLTLPADFAPATLRLPACFVATGTYLRYFAPTVRNLFVDAGDLKVAVRTYAYFAEQVLSAEKEQDRIELTVRGDRIPMELVQVLEQEAPRSSSSHVLGVAWAFKALLAGLPGGILGSEQLYQVLVKISRGRLSGGDAEGRRGGLGELSPNSSARIKAIALVLLALTDAPRLNLICAVFGICAVLLHESERSAQLSRQSITGSLRGNLGTGLASVERLGGVFGRLLRGGGDDGEDGRGRQESQQVGELLVRNWRGVSRQLRIWESRRMGQTGVFSWIGEGKTGEQEADVEGDTP
ncbi:hypothetical protein BDV59DRAFT_182902 [Aspergillus ambiguus]|uniref:uncharacterized protein n=1 Tax=Aspergillus ambiguus TaxID=176160 RepID=UPI003CCD860C